MKNFKTYISILIISIIGIVSCQLDEDPNFLSSTNLFDDVNGANIALNGVYASLNDYGYYNSEFHHALNWTSGMYNSNREGSLVDIAALNPSTNDKFIDNVWAAIYRTVSRVNNVIIQLEANDLGDPDGRDKLLGQAFFIRALAYFDIVRIWGKGPLIVGYLDGTEPSVGISGKADIFQQIISDVELASQLLADAGENEPGRPTRYAAHMLAAQVYMWFAGDQTSGETEYWQKAYEHAIKVYGNYQLMENFEDLWLQNTRNNNQESIFEIQCNAENTNRLAKYWSASNAHVGRNTWARFKINLEVYDRHVNTYPGDPRIEHSFKTSFNKYATNGSSTEQVTYPVFTSRGNRDKSYPYGKKYFLQDETVINPDNDWNYVVFRYGELLLMLAECENELNGPGNAYQYVNELLNRARNSVDTISVIPADWSGMTQKEFRDAITMEYIFELQQEGKDFFHVRRRGWDFFREFVILSHNLHPLYDFSIERDIEYPDNERIMVLPIPDSEINTNSEITAAQQNPGY